MAPPISKENARKTVTGSDPAAGAEFSETIPAGKIWNLIAIAVAFVADATVASRTPEIIIDDGTNEILRLTDRTVITASQTRTLQANRFGVLPADTATVHYFILPLGFELPAGYRVRSVTTNLQAGDNYGAPKLIVDEYVIVP